MKFASVLENATKFLSGIKLSGKGEKLCKLDFGILEVAMMVAALDGDVTESEIASFNTLAVRCRGANAKAVKSALSATLRRAGYILLIARLGTKNLVDVFVQEAVAALPGGFLCGSESDLRRAFVTWIAMGIADGDYSDVERQAIAELKKTFADIRTAQVKANVEAWSVMSPTFRMAYGAPRPPACVKLLPDGFLAEAETLVRDLGTASKCAKAEAGLAALLKG